MHIKDKIFPYPILNHNKVFSNFNNCDFIFSFTPIENDNEYILKGSKFVTDSKLINDLFDEDKILVNCIIECSYTVYRKAFCLSKSPTDIILSKNDFVEKVEFSMFATAKEKFVLKSNEVDEDYADIEFEIEKYDILAANDGFTQNFIHKEDADNLAHSIFSIVINHDMVVGDPYIVECDTSKKITITMSDAEYKNYKVIYMVPTYMEVIFNMLLVPALVEGLSLCKNHANSDSNIDLYDIGNKYLWFRAVTDAYKRIYGVDFTIEDFKKTSSVKLAQDLLGKPLAESLKKLVEETKGIGDVDENE